LFRPAACVRTKCPGAQIKTKNVRVNTIGTCQATHDYTGPTKSIKIACSNKPLTNTRKIKQHFPMKILHGQDTAEHPKLSFPVRFAARASQHHAANRTGNNRFSKTIASGAVRCACVSTTQRTAPEIIVKLFKNHH
jgi:hypothetical protein